MVKRKKQKKLKNWTLWLQNKPRNTIWLMIFIFMMLGIPLISAFGEQKGVIDVGKGEQLTIGDNQLAYDEYEFLWEKYPPIQIKNFFGLGEVLMQGAITENTETCDKDCNSAMQLYLANDGVLIDDVRFYDENGNDARKFIIGYHIYVDGNLYNLGDEVQAGTYDVRIEGKKLIEKTVDWQIKTQGQWTTDWALWRGGAWGVYDNFSDGIFNNIKWQNTTGVTEAIGNLTLSSTVSSGGIVRQQFWQNASIINSSNVDSMNFTVYHSDTISTTDTGVTTSVYIFGTLVDSLTRTTVGTSTKFTNISISRNLSNASVFNYYLNKVLTGYITPTSPNFNFTTYIDLGVPHSGTAIITLFPVTYSSLYSYITLISPLNLFEELPNTNVNFNCTYNFDAYPINATNISLITNGARNLTNYPYRNFDGATQYINASSLIVKTNQSGTISTWVKTNQIYTTNSAWIISHYSSTTGVFGLSFRNNYYLRYAIDGASSDPFVYATNTWYHLVLVWNGTNYWGYRNGVLDATGTYIANNTDRKLFIGTFNNDGTVDLTASINGSIDEIRIYNRSLFQSEITSLYNSGRTEIINGTINQTGLALYSRMGYTLTDDSGAGNTLTNVGSTPAIDTTFAQTFPVNTYAWNCQVCDSDGDCGTGLTSRDLLIKNVAVKSVAYNTITIEGLIESYSVNITYSPAIYNSISATLNYDGVDYATTQTGSGGNLVFSTTKSAPAVTTNSNKIFYWKFIVVNPSTTVNVNSQNFNQIVNNINLDDCSSYSTLLYNFTLLDEELKTKINQTSNVSSINVNLLISPYGSSSSSYFVNFSKYYNKTNPARICSDINLTSNSYRVDLTADFEAIDYSHEFYYIDNGIINNATIPQNINFYDLLTADTTDFVFTFLDENSIVVPNGLVHVYRKYISDGLFKEVEIARMDSNGNAILHLVQNNVIYYFVITRNGATIYTSDFYTATCLTSPCQIQINAQGLVPAVNTDWTAIPYGTYTLTSDGATRTVTLQFTLNSSHTMALTVYKYSNTPSLATIVGTTSINATSGTLNIVVPLSAGNITYVARVEQNGNFISDTFVSFIERGYNYFGTTGLVLAGLMLIALALMVASEGVLAIVLFCVALFLITVLRILDMSWYSLIGIICAGGIIVWKLANRR